MILFFISMSQLNFMLNSLIFLFCSGIELQTPPEAKLVLLQPQHLQHRLAGK
jgi:hypothetical protein